MARTAGVMTAIMEKPLDRYSDTDKTSQQRPSTLLDDVEGQKLGASKRDTPGYTEYEVPLRAKMVNVGIWFLLNLTLTIYNKAVLGGFAFPWLLTAIHTGSTSIGCTIFLRRNHFSFTKLSQRGNMIVIAFSFLFTINIALSNISLALVSVPFHQIMRSTAPIYTVILQYLWFHRIYAFATYCTLVPITFGAAMTTSGDLAFTPFGFFLTLLGVVISVIKTLVGNNLMTGTLSMPTLEVLVRLTPLAAVQCVFFSIMTGEFAQFLAFAHQGSLTNSLMLALLGNGVLACALNISSFQTNKLAGALTLSIAGNLKECLTILLGIVFFSVEVNFISAVGMFTTVMGGAWYSKVELDTKEKHSQGDS